RDGAGACARGRAEQVRGLGGAGAPDDVEAARRRPADGRARPRLAGDVLDRPLRRRARRRHRLPREAPGTVPTPAERGPAAVLSVVAAAAVHAAARLTARA